MKLTIASILLLFAVITGCTKTEDVITSIYPNGNPIRISTYKMVNDSTRELIKEVRFYQNGEKKQHGEFKNEVKHGKWTYWYENGNKWSEANFNLGVTDGESIVWYENGEIKYRGDYKNGDPHDVWTFYDDKGKKLKDVYYEDGDKIKEENFE